MVAPIIAAAAPAAASLLAKGLAAAGGWAGLGVGAGSFFIPSIIDTLLSSKTPEQAAKALSPIREAKIAQLMGSGMHKSQAIAQVDEEMQGEVQAKMQEGTLPEWANMALGLAAGFAGSKLVKSRSPADGLKAPFAKSAPSPADLGHSKGELPIIPDLKKDPGIVSPFGPRLPPRKGTPINEDFPEQSLPTGKTGIDEIDEIPDDVSELVSPFAKRRMSLRDAELMKIMSANPQGY